MSEPWLLPIEVLGWTLVHFVWQGLVLAAALGLALLLVPRRRAGLRYALGCVTLALMAAAPPATAWRLLQGVADRPASVPVPSAAAFVRGDAPPAAPQALAFTPALAEAVPPGLRGSLPPLSWVVGAWLLGVMVTSLRLAGGWWRA